jgi:hypothetical protein
MLGMLCRPAPVSMYVGRVGEPVEGRVRERGAVGVPQVSRAAAVGTDVIELLVPAEQLEELDRLRRPARHVPGQLLEDRRRAFPSPVAQRIGDERALVPVQRRRTAEASHAEQVAEVRDHPRLAGLDEPVVVELLDIGPEHAELVIDHVQEALERAADARVADAVDGRQEVVQPVHERTSTMAPAGSSTTSSAGAVAVPVPVQRAIRARIGSCRTTAGSPAPFSTW